MSPEEARILPCWKLIWNLIALFIHSISFPKTLLKKDKNRRLRSFQRGKRVHLGGRRCKQRFVRVYQLGENLNVYLRCTVAFVSRLFSAYLTTKTSKLHFAIQKLPLTIAHAVLHSAAYFRAMAKCLLAFLSFNNRFPRTVCFRQDRLR